MNIASIQWPTFNPYGKATVELYVSGCNRRCKNCHNPELQNYNYGESINFENLINYLKDREKLFSIISITGGDLLEQKESEAEELILKLKENFPHKEYWLFTGATFEEFVDIEEQTGDILFVWIKKYFDYIKVGPYKEELKQEGFPSSSNQKLLKKGKDY